MARSHHRKKHKSHLQQFRHSHDTSVSSPKARGKATSIFTIVGAALGFAIGYFATQGTMLWLVVGLLAGGVAGYLIGRRIDSEDAG
jgi:VIT1/CCC1 family predicted Fe2+/Mn2+ transporter